jgi:hypothetical protein
LHYRGARGYTFRSIPAGFGYSTLKSIRRRFQDYSFSLFIINISILQIFSICLIHVVMSCAKIGHYTCPRIQVPSVGTYERECAEGRQASLLAELPFNPGLIRRSISKMPLWLSLICANRRYARSERAPVKAWRYHNEQEPRALNFQSSRACRSHLSLYGDRTQTRVSINISHRSDPIQYCRSWCSPEAELARHAQKRRIDHFESLIYLQSLSNSSLTTLPRIAQYHFSTSAEYVARSETTRL